MEGRQSRGRALMITISLIVMACDTVYTAEECNTRDDPKGLQYTGTVNKTYSGIPCQRWADKSPNSHTMTAADLPENTLEAAENYCRNPTGDASPWCYSLDPNVRWQRCHVMACDCKSENDALGHAYVGTRNSTKSGLGCQRWDMQTPHTHSVGAGNLADDSLTAAENFCRNYAGSGSAGGPWCYTEDENVRWEYCFVPTCECSASYTVSSQTFTSPLYPSAYPNNLNCSWQITVEQGKVVALDFETFGLQSSANCKFDSVTIYDGSSRTDPVLGKYCGETVPFKTYSSGNSMLVTFWSDATNGGDGFKVGYITREKRSPEKIERERREYLKNTWEQQTRDELMRDYRQDIPSLSGGPVNISYTLTKIIDVDEKGEEIALAVYITVWWRDERLVYDLPDILNDTDISETAYEHGKLIFKLSQIWYPNVVHYNNVGESSAELLNKDMNTITDGTGVLYWSKNIVLTSPCDMDVTYFPVDTQVCEVIFSIEPQGPVKLSGYVNARTDPNAYYPDSAWSINREKDIETLNNDYLTVTFRQTFKRRYQYYISRILGPVSIISILVVCVFIIPPDAGEKISLGVTLLLTFSVFQMIVDDELPASSTTTPLITRAMILLQLCSALSIVASVLVLHVHNISSERGNKIPRWLRWIFFTVLAKVTLHAGDVRRVTGDQPAANITKKVAPAELGAVEFDFTTNKVHRESKFEPPGKEAMLFMMLNKIDSRLEELPQKIAEGGDDNTASEWKLLALILDRTLMYACVITMGIVYSMLFIQLHQQM